LATKTDRHRALHSPSRGDFFCEGRFVPFQREAEAILREWRAVEGELEVANPQSPEAEALQAEAERLRDAYRRTVNMQHESGGHELPPFPEPTPSG
jgi:hypothetical protein